ncbi:hypothetical protein RRG08_053181 [Elysia crispata]|uniref:Uncharacterized protein n=1 Tax=Elysia crispata TaxID=231223 RepID=A0AAE0YQK2_9GAST|nr:hypothetical protein RRG08_053181 [Elysia crispata]
MDRPKYFLHSEIPAAPRQPVDVINGVWGSRLFPCVERKQNTRLVMGSRGYGRRQALTSKGGAVRRSHLDTDQLLTWGSGPPCRPCGGGLQRPGSTRLKELALGFTTPAPVRTSVDPGWGLPERQQPILVKSNNNVSYNNKGNNCPLSHASQDIDTETIRAFPIILIEGPQSTPPVLAVPGLGFHYWCGRFGRANHERYDPGPRAISTVSYNGFRRRCMT